MSEKKYCYVMVKKTESHYSTVQPARVSEKGCYVTVNRECPRKVVT